MAIQIPNHSHCMICSRAVHFGEKTCSRECEDQRMELERKRRRSVTAMYVLMGFAILVLLLSYTGIFG